MRFMPKEARWNSWFDIQMPHYNESTLVILWLYQEKRNLFPIISICYSEVSCLSKIIFEHFSFPSNNLAGLATSAKSLLKREIHLCWVGHHFSLFATVISVFHIYALVNSAVCWCILIVFLLPSFKMKNTSCSDVMLYICLLILLCSLNSQFLQDHHYSFQLLWVTVFALLWLLLPLHL